MPVVSDTVCLISDGLCFVIGAAQWEAIVINTVLVCFDHLSFKSENQLTNSLDKNRDNTVHFSVL